MRNESGDCIYGLLQQGGDISSCRKGMLMEIEPCSSVIRGRTI